MRYKSPNATPVQVIVDGLTATVGPEFSELPEKFHAAAEVQGCVAEGQTTREANQQQAKEVGRTSDPNPQAQQNPASPGRAATRPDNQRSKT